MSVELQSEAMYQWQVAFLEACVQLRHVCYLNKRLLNSRG